MIKPLVNYGQKYGIDDFLRLVRTSEDQFGDSAIPPDSAIRKELVPARILFTKLSGIKFVVWNESGSPDFTVWIGIEKHGYEMVATIDWPERQIPKRIGETECVELVQHEIELVKKRIEGKEHKKYGEPYRLVVSIDSIAPVFRRRAPRFFFALKHAVMSIDHSFPAILAVSALLDIVERIDVNPH